MSQRCRPAVVAAFSGGPMSTPDSVLLDGFYRLFGRHIQREDLSRISAQLEPQTANARTKTEA
jgi:hypothetical protein